MPLYPSRLRLCTGCHFKTITRVPRQSSLSYSLCTSQKSITAVVQAPDQRTTHPRIDRPASDSGPCSRAAHRSLSHCHSHLHPCHNLTRLHQRDPCCSTTPAAEQHSIFLDKSTLAQKQQDSTAAAADGEETIHHVAHEAQGG